MAKYETLNVNPKSKISIDKLAKKFEMSKVDLVEKMVFYFEKTGINPEDVKVLSVADELNKFRDTIISFIRKQEKDFILPTFGKMDTLIVRMKEYIDDEAPKMDSFNGQTKNRTFQLNETFGEKKEIPTMVQPNKQSIDLEEFEKLKNDNTNLQAKLKDAKKYLENILNHTSYKSTGLTKMTVVDLPTAEINSYKIFIIKHL